MKNAFALVHVMHIIPMDQKICIWFKHILFRRKGLGAAYNTTMPSPEEVLQKNLITHTHTHTSKNRMFDNIKRNNN